LLSWASLSTAFKRLEKDGLLQDSKFDAWGRVGAAIVSALYSVANSLTTLMQKIASLRLLTRKVGNKYFHYSFVKGIAKWLFKAAAVMTAVFDIKKGLETWGAGNRLVGGLWIASGVTAFASVFAFFAAGWPMIILFMISIAIMALIMIFCDNEFQTWLSRCIFGNGDGSGKRYSSIEEEMLALEKAGE